MRNLGDMTTPKCIQILEDLPNAKFDLTPCLDKYFDSGLMVYTCETANDSLFILDLNSMEHVYELSFDDTIDIVVAS